MLMLVLLACRTEETQAPQTVDQAPLRRMTERQFNNTMQDLFPEIEIPYLILPDSGVEGFYDNDTSLNAPNDAVVSAIQEVSLQISLALHEEEIFEDCNEADCIVETLLPLSSQFWRRPLSSAERTELEQLFRGWSDASSPEIAGMLGIQYLIQSPEFLYFPEVGIKSGKKRTLNSYELASRMSYLLWNTMPDEELLKVAKDDSLLQSEVLVEQAWRMISHQKANEGVINFHRQWLHWDKIGTDVIDFEKVILYEGQEEEGYQLVSDYLHLELQPQMRLEPELFVVEHVLNGQGTLSNLLTSRQYFTTHSLSNLYGVDLGDGPSIYWEGRLPFPIDEDFVHGYEFVGFTAPENERAGILTTLGFLHSTANPSTPSPVQRGVMVLDQLLCQPPMPPPDDVPALEENSEIPTTNREKYSAHVANPACAGCHESIDGIGFTFENYDALGRYQTLDNGYQIDASGEIVFGDAKGAVRDAVHLAEKLSTSRTTHDCVTEHWMRYAFARQEWNDGDKQLRSYLQEGFWKSGGDIPELLVNIVASPAFRTIGGE